MTNSKTEDDAFERLLKARDQYVEAFGEEPCENFMMMYITYDYIADTILEHVNKGKRIPKNYNWYKFLPPGAMS